MFVYESQATLEQQKKQKDSEIETAKKSNEAVSRG